MLFFFFFKQKTAYEMRISDWSSDVCSSDLLRIGKVAGDPAANKCRRIDQRENIHCRGGRVAEPTGIERSARQHPHRAQFEHEFVRIVQRGQSEEIGRASCRERVCQYV